MSTPRKHHYIPKSFLAAWTNSGTPDGSLQVIDKSTGNAWSVKPVNAAKETDLYMIDVSETSGEIAATEIETNFGIIEGAASPILKRMLEGEAMVSGEDREKVLSLLATLVARVPSRLDWIDEIMRKPVEIAYRRLEAEGKLPQPDDPKLAALMNDWFDQGKIRIEIKQNARLEMMASMLPTLLQLFMLRHWTVLRTRPDAGDLICTDDPVLLLWDKPVPNGESPGFGLANTLVFVPIGPAAARVGLWMTEARDPTLTWQDVMSWNALLLNQVNRFVFSRRDFLTLHTTDAIHSRNDVIRSWTRKE